MRKRSLRSMLAMAAATALALEAAAGWYDPAWSFRRQITIPADRISGTLSNFPVVVQVTASAALAAAAQADGDDILFTAGDGTNKLDHELEEYAAASGKLVAWVRVPRLSSATHAVLYLYAGNAGASNQQNAAGVWAEAFRGVWHLKEVQAGRGTAAVYTDSSGYANHGDDYVSAAGKDGRLNGGQQFDSTSNDYVRVPSAAALDLTNQITVEAWIRSEQNLAGYRRIAEKRYNTSWYFGTRDTQNSLSVFIGAERAYTPADAFRTGAWNHVAFTYNKDAGGTDEVKLYANGALRASGDYSSPIGVDADPVKFGIDFAMSGSAFDGWMDEVRISGVARSRDWIATSYTNQLDPESFAVLGPGPAMVTLATVPPGLEVAADGVTNVCPVTVAWDSNSVHRVSVSSPQTNGLSRYVFTAWSDGGEPAHDVTATGTVTLTAQFATQHLWSVTVDPPAAGRVTPETGWFDAGTAFTATAARNPGYGFVRWEGDLAGTDTNLSVSLDSPVVVTAKFEITGSVVTIDSDPSGRDLVVDGIPTTGETYVWEDGSTHTVAVAEVTQVVGNSRYLWQDWSDGGAAEHTVGATQDFITVTARFLTQHKWRWTAFPPAGGTVSPPSDVWHDRGASFTAQASAAWGFSFGLWSGSFGGAAPSVPVTMDAPVIVTAHFTKPAVAGVIYVRAAAPGNNSGTDWPNAFRRLDDALAAATGGRDIWVAAGTYTSAAPFQMKSGVDLFGGFLGFEDSLAARDWDAYPARLDGEHARAVMNGTSNAVLDGFTIANGTAASGAGLYLNNVAPAVRNCTFIGNVATNGSGGAVYCYGEAADAEFSNCVFRANTATNHGGALATYAADPLIRRCRFVENRSAAHGGCLYNENATTWLLTDSTFVSNRATGVGGVIYSASATPVNMTNCVFRENRAGSFGGVAYLYANALALKRCDFIGNRAVNGGALYNYNSVSGYAEDCAFIGNAATNGSGGALYNYVGPAAVFRRCTFADNAASAGAGAVFSYESGIYEACVFSANRSAGAGGAFSSWGSAVKVKRCLFAGNEAATHGGVMYHDNSAAVVWENDVLAGNAAGGYGGGLFALNSFGVGFSRLVHCTLSGNRAATGGGGLASGAAFVPITNCIFWGNAAATNGHEIHEQTVGKAVADHCDVRGGWPGMGNLDADPLFEGGPSGAWTAVGPYDPAGGQTALTDSNTAWAPQMLAGCTVNPDTGQWLQFVIASNSAHTLYVWGNALTNRADAAVAQAGDAYEVHDFRQRPGSPCVDSAAGTDVTNDFRGAVRLQPPAGLPDLGAYEGAITHEVHFEKAASLFSELDGAVTIPVRLDTLLHDRTGTVRYVVSGGSASNGVDFVLAEGTLTFDLAHAYREIVLTILDNASDDGVRTVQLALVNPTNVTVSAPGAHTLTIVDDDGTPEVSFDLAAASGPETVSPVILGVSLTHPRGRTVTVQYAVTGGTAVPGGDVALSPGTLTFVTGETHKEIALLVFDGPSPKDARAVEISLSAPVNAVLGAVPVHLYTILDDDRLYVDRNAGGANTGLNWADACTDLKTALALADSGDEIWVAAATYSPGSFQLATNAAVYGGFTNGMGSLSKRNWTLHTTILSGGGPVVNGAPGARLDGFTVTGGNGVNGGGMALANGDMVVANCEFRNNVVTTSGGGLYMGYSSSLVERCRFLNNDGGGSGGGGMYIYGGAPTVRNCVFIGNTTTAYDGGGMQVNSSPARIENCTFTANIAYRQGGAIEVYSADSSIVAVMKNCILWNNRTTKDATPPNGGWEICVQNDARLEMSYTDVTPGPNWLYQRGSGLLIDLGGNLNADPLFADPAGGDVHLKSVAGRWSSAGWVYDSTNSPCIDKGNPADDFLNEQEPNGGRINMGAYGNTWEASKSGKAGPGIAGGAMLIVR